MADTSTQDSTRALARHAMNCANSRRNQTRVHLAPCSRTQSATRSFLPVPRGVHIVEVATRIDARCGREIDTDRRTCTPGIVDIQTHCDGLATRGQIVALSNILGVILELDGELRCRFWRPYTSFVDNLRSLSRSLFGVHFRPTQKCGQARCRWWRHQRANGTAIFGLAGG